MAKVTEKSTKGEIWAAYQALMSEATGKPVAIAEDASGLQKMATVLGEVKSSLGTAFDETLEKLAALPQAYTEAEQDLARRRASALEAIEQDKKQLEAIIASVRTAWEQEKADTELARQREADEYTYNLTRKRRDETEAYEQKTKAREAALATREAAVKEHEDTLKTLTAEVEAFPAKLEAAVKTAETATATSLKTDYETTVKELKQTAAHEASIATLKLQTAEATAAAHAKQITDLQRQLDAAQSQLKDMAVTVIEANKPHQPVAAVN